MAYLQGRHPFPMSVVHIYPSIPTGTPTGCMREFLFSHTSNRRVKPGAIPWAREVSLIDSIQATSTGETSILQLEEYGR